MKINHGYLNLIIVHIVVHIWVITPPGKMPCEIWTRVVGYFRPVKQFNPGKKEEFRERVLYKLNRDKATKNA